MVNRHLEVVVNVKMPCYFILSKIFKSFHETLSKNLEALGKEEGIDPRSTKNNFKKYNSRKINYIFSNRITPECHPVCKEIFK